MSQFPLNCFYTFDSAILVNPPQNTFVNELNGQYCEAVVFFIIFVWRTL